MRCLHNLQHLCLIYCKSLSEMPSKMRELTDLKTLSMFVVGFNRSSQLEELECLNLSGRLELRHLEKVKDHLDAKKSNLAQKNNLRELSFSWERYGSSKLGEDVDEKVLEALEPPSNLEQLRIKGFSGRYFPVWMTSSTMGQIVRIEIVDCINCRRLPNLGALPHLTALLLENVGVEYIIEDEEVVNGDQVMIQFLALRQLYLIDLPNLKGLSKEQESKEAFPNLKHLWILGCSSLMLRPLSSFKTLEHLHCSSSILGIFSQVDTLTLLRVMVEEKLACFPMVTLVRFANLCNLTIDGANEISVPGEGMQTLKRLEDFSISKCERMRCLPKGLLPHLTTLKRLGVHSCPELQDLPEEIKHLHNLRSVDLSDLPKMACLPEALQHLSSLKNLTLGSLHELESLPEWLHQLTTLTLEDCPKLVSLPPAILYNLKFLTVMKCRELERRCERGSGVYWHNIAHIPLLRIG